VDEPRFDFSEMFASATFLAESFSFAHEFFSLLLVLMTNPPFFCAHTPCGTYDSPTHPPRCLRNLEKCKENGQNVTCDNPTHPPRCLRNLESRCQISFDLSPGFLRYGGLLSTQKRRIKHLGGLSTPSKQSKFVLGIRQFSFFGGFWSLLS